MLYRIVRIEPLQFDSATADLWGAHSCTQEFFLEEVHVKSVNEAACRAAGHWGPLVANDPGHIEIHWIDNGLRFSARLNPFIYGECKHCNGALVPRVHGNPFCPSCTLT